MLFKYFHAVFKLCQSQERENLDEIGFKVGKIGFFKGFYDMFRTIQVLSVGKQHKLLRCGNIWLAYVGFQLRPYQNFREFHKCHRANTYYRNFSNTRTSSCPNESSYKMVSYGSNVHLLAKCICKRKPHRFKVLKDVSACSSIPITSILFINA